MRIIPILAASIVTLSLGGCFTTQNIGTGASAALGAAAGAAVGSYYTQPRYSQPRYYPERRTRTVVYDRPTYVRPARRTVTRVEYD